MSAKWLWVTIVAVICLGAGVAVWSVNGEGEAPPHHGSKGQCGAHMGRLTEQLTADQRAELKAKITELKTSGASPEEIHAAIKELLQDAGVEVPPGGQGGCGHSQASSGCGSQK